MRTTRLAEVLLPLLAARSWVPWLPEPKNLQEPPTPVHPLIAASISGSSPGHEQRRLFDDVQ